MIDKKRHIRIDEEIDNKILTSIKHNKNSYTKEINIILKKGFEVENSIDKVENLTKIMNECVNLLNTNLLLTKQLYADMDFQNPIDPNKSQSLKQVFINMRKDKYND